MAQLSQEESHLLLNIPQVAKAMTIGRTAAWKLVYTGKLRSVRIGRSVRVPVAELQRFIDEQTTVQ